MTAPDTESLRHKRITGKQRDQMTKKIVSAYKKGASIRSIAAEHDRSYGFIHRVLSEAEVELRRRGGFRGNKAR